MTPGALADRAWTAINRAGGQLGGMVVRKALNARQLRQVLSELERAENLLREIIKENKR